jgi:hypothetical protein
MIFIFTKLAKSENEYTFMYITINPRIYRYVKELIIKNHIGGLMASVLTSSAVDHGIEPRSGQTKEYKIGICCFSAKHIALRRKSKDLLARNQNNVSEWSDRSTRGLLFQRVDLVKSRSHHLTEN